MADKMNPKLKAKWVSALRSGKYTQNRGDLGVGEKLCCLGVLSACQNRWVAPDVPQVLFWSEYIGGDHMPLVEMNDTQGKSFDEIADYIEEHY